MLRSAESPVDTETDTITQLRMDGEGAIIPQKLEGKARMLNIPTAISAIRKKRPASFRRERSSATVATQKERSGSDRKK